MTKKIDFRQSWSSVGSGTPEFANTLAQLEIYAGGYNLTRNENIFSQSIQDHVIVSSYPLALWMLQNWWRLLYEPLPANNKPDISWRMAHELGAANHGFVWPKILFASDSQNVQVWSIPSDANCQQSVRYINGLNNPVSISIADFRQALFDFISTVENRLEAFRLESSDVSALLTLLKEEEQIEESRIYRKLEALMGFDPDECSSYTMEYAIRLYEEYGESTLSELAPVYGKMGQEEPLKHIEKFISATGVYGKPTFSTTQKASSTCSDTVPWKVAVENARELRNEIGNTNNPIDTKTLFELLGIASSAIDKWEPMGRSSVSVGIPTGDQTIKFVPRKKHPISKRFELSRYVGDFMQTASNQWLTNTDLGTYRQKYQRAFAAEFLCPIDGLIGFLENDFSNEAIEDAAYHFNVSEQTITSLLANNHYTECQTINESPYHIGYN
ncbi:ImmA/IrrE family metallo-endopeptidase [Desulfonatronum thiodismutans]|uniref:ImmA/IrrE family metallo-endopeptidase n=1 Tax=Desulfonatronum thiodismutans TaxID=159290 RepID=UPI000A6B061D|nr:hypothetical protein [Desulfonatronum thiodismutans]